MDLPTTIVKSTRKSPSKLVVYGPPKVGKTSMFAALENCLIIDCEDGSDYVDALKIKVNSLAQLRNACLEIVKRGKPYKYVAVDTIDKVEEWCEKDATDLYKSSPMGKSFTGDSVLKLPQGAGYLWLRTSFHKTLDILKTIAPTVILIGHLRDKVLDNSGKGEVTSKDLDLTGKIRNIVCSWADAIGYTYRKTDEGQSNLYLTFETKELVACGARADHLRGKTFKFTYPQAVSEDWLNIFVD